MDRNNRKNEGLDSGLRKVLESYAMGLRTLLIGRVESYDAIKQSAVVQPVLMRKFGDNPSEPLPPLLDVPVSMMGSGDMIVTVNLTAGTYVLVGIVDRSIEIWKNDGGVVDPLAPGHHHRLSDAILIQVLRPFSEAIESQQPGIDIRSIDGSVNFNISPSGIVINGDITLTGNITQTGNINTDGTIDATGEITGNGIALSTHTHPYTWTDPGGSGNTSPPQ